MVELATPSTAACEEDTVITKNEDIVRLNRWVTIIWIVLIVLIMLAEFHDAWQDYHSTIDTNEKVQLSVSRALAEQAALLTQEVDLILGTSADWLVSPEGRAAEEESMNARLQEEIHHLAFVQSAALIGANGQILASTSDDFSESRDFRLRKVFSVPQKIRGNALYIDRPDENKHDQNAVFSISRRINGADGEFEGVAIASVSLDYLADFYTKVTITPDTVIRLSRDDGVTLARYPRKTTTADRRAVDQTFTTALATEQVRGTTHDGIDRIVTIHRVADYPMIIEVDRPLSSILKPWVQSTVENVIRTLMLIAVAAALLVMLRSAFNRYKYLESGRRQLERDLENLQRAQSLGMLAASVAHDFNNVLSAIVGYGELAQKNLDNGTPARTSIDRLLSSAGRARLLVRSVLTFNPNRSVNYQPVLIEPIVSEVLQQIQPTLPESVHIKTRDLDDATTIQGDATEVYQVVMNLCSNAIHVMPSGGLLELQLESIEISSTRTLVLGELYPGRWLRLLISDSGPGMTIEQQKAIFDPFYTTRENGQGTGIGLTVVRNIILRMHGALDVDSRPGEGTRMSVYWPENDAIQMPIETGANARSVQGHGETIMVVDDDAELVMLAEEMLATLGYEAIGFTGSSTALKAFQLNPQRFDLVLTDENMRFLRGTDLAKKIHAINTTIPIILITGQHDSEVDRRAEAAGVALILDKPLSIETLQVAIAGQIPDSD